MKTAGMRRSVAGLTMCVAGLAAAPAGAAAPPSVEGACELGGNAVFDHPVTNATRFNGGTFHSDDGLANCVGTLKVGGRSYGPRVWPVRATGRSTGNLSCAAGTLTGRATLLFLRPDGRPLRLSGSTIAFRARIVQHHVVAAGLIDFVGRPGSRAGGIYNFTPSASAIGGCFAAGDKRLPMTVRMSTLGSFTGLG